MIVYSRASTSQTPASASRARSPVVCGASSTWRWDSFISRRGRADRYAHHALPEEADHLAQQVAIIDHGQIVVEGTPEGLKAELRGDAIQVELAETCSESNVRTALSGLDGTLREVAIDGRVLRARVDSGASALPVVLAALDTAGIRALTATVARPSLDDVYLRYTGRSYTTASQKEAIR